MTVPRVKLKEKVFCLHVREPLHIKYISLEINIAVVIDTRIYFWSD